MSFKKIHQEILKKSSKFRIVKNEIEKNGIIKIPSCLMKNFELPSDAEAELAAEASPASIGASASHCGLKRYPPTLVTIENISKKQDTLIINEIEKTLITDFLIIEKINQNNLFRENLLPDSGNRKIKRNGCIDRDLNLWKVSTTAFTD